MTEQLTGPAATMDRLEDQIGWYDRKSGRAQKLFKGLKALTLVIAALIPLLALTLKDNKVVVAILGAMVAVIEGIQQMNQYQHLWSTYRSTAEQLRHEKYLYLAKAGAYATAENPDRLLAERVEELVSQEHAKWTALRDKASTPAAR